MAALAAALETLFASELWATCVCYTTVLLACEAVFCVPALPRRAHWAFRLLVGIPAYALLCNAHLIMPLVGGTWLVSIVAVYIFLSSALLIWFAFDVRFSYAVFIAAAGQSLEGILFIIRKAQEYFPQLPDCGVVANTLAKIGCCAVFLALIWLLQAKRGSNQRCLEVRSMPMLLFICLTEFCTNLMSTWVRNIGAQSAPYAVCSAFCCVLLLILQFDIFKTSRLESERDVMRHLFHLREQQQRENQESMEIVNVKFHDLKHQIAALRQMDTGPEREQSLEDLEHSIRAYDASVASGDPAVDALLTEKSMRCWAKGIAFTCVCDGRCLSWLGVVDLYTLLGNALDNAIEAAEKVPAGQARVVCVKVWRQADLACVEVENSCTGEVRLEDGLPATSKDDARYHGFGLKSVRSIAEAHGGSLSLETQPGRFTLRVVLPVPKEAPAGERS